MNKVTELIKKIGAGRLILMLFAGVLLVAASSFDKGDNVYQSENNTSEKKYNNSAKTTDTKENVMENTSEGSEGTQNYRKSEYEERFEEILAYISGVTDVKVMITYEAAEEKVVLKEKITESDTINESDSYGGVRMSNTSKTEEKVIYIKDEEGNEVPYVSTTNEPVIKGVLVVVKGQKNPDTELAITESAMVLFGTDAHKVKVLWMD